MKKLNDPEYDSDPRKKWKELPKDRKKFFSPCCCVSLIKEQVFFHPKKGDSFAIARCVICSACKRVTGKLAVCTAATKDSDANKGLHVAPRRFNQQSWMVMKKQDTAVERFNCEEDQNGNIVPLGHKALFADLFEKNDK